jgi:cellulose biosynthesis protein BcsQ
MSEFVVMNSQSLRDALFSLGIPTSPVEPDTSEASRKVYELALNGQLAGVIVSPPHSEEMLAWLDQYATSGIPILLLGHPQRNPNSISLALPAPLHAVVTALGYAGVITNTPDLVVDQNGSVLSVQEAPNTSLGASDLDFLQPRAPLPDTSPAVRQHSGLQTPVLMSVSGKGGVGKTTIGAVQSASFAHRYRGARVLLIDGNPGQGDIRRYLKLHWKATSDLPDITYYQQGQSWQDVVVSSDTLDELSSMQMPIPFDVVMAPAHGTEANTATPPAELYLDLVRTVANDPEKRYDLIVIDTQIIETNYTGVMVYSLLVPLLREGAYVVGVFDNSTPGYKNTHQALQLLKDNSRAGADRFAYIANMLDAAIQLQGDSLDGVWMAGQIPMDVTVQQIVSGMEDASQSIELFSAMSRLFERVLGPMDNSLAVESFERKRKGLPSFLRRRK